MFSRTWRSLLDSFPRRGPSRLVTVASERQEDLSDCWGRACSGVGSCIGTEGARGWGRHPRTQMTLPAGHGTPGLPLLPPSPEPRGLGVTPAGPPGTPREPPGKPEFPPPEKRDFPPRGNFPPARGPPRGGPPGTPQNGVFFEGYFVFFCALRVYTPLYPPKWPKKGSKKVSRFCPDWESY